MFGLLEVLLVMVFDLDVVLDLVLDELVLLRKYLLQIVDFGLFLLQFAAHPAVLLLIVLELVLQQTVLDIHLVDVGLGFEYLPVDLVNPAIEIA